MPVLSQSTAMSRVSATDATRPADRTANAAVSSWECPLCDASGVQLVQDGDEADRAVEALMGHLRSSDDAIHGPSPSYPDAIDVDALAGNPGTGDRAAGTE